MKSLTFITGNQNKVVEISRYLDFPILHTKLDIPEIQSLDLEKVATDKAKKAYQTLGTPVLVEDTALAFKSLQGLPGPLVKWFFESIGNDGLIKMLAGYKSRVAVAETCFALCDESGVRLFKGARKGKISHCVKGSNDFGWDPIFIPEGSEKTWAEMEPEQRAETSMRKIALKKLQTYLEVNYT